MRNSLDLVLKQDMCAGCGLCVKDKNDMQISNKGFLRPKNPLSDQMSQNLCPSITVAHHNLNAKYSDLWGPIESSYTGYSLDDGIRYQGSSGGMLTALLAYLLKSGKVDAVVQVGVSKNDPIRNETYIHTDVADIVKCSGSRYAPSSPLNVIRSLLGDGRRYAVVGKPCDIAAMRALTVEFPEYDEQFPYLLAFMCAGVPSEKGTVAVLEKLGISRKVLKSFRYRGEGWPGMTKAEDSEGNMASMTYNESWGKILNRHVQPRCKLCADGIGEAADIVCGDAWHASEDGYPSFDEEAGLSLTIARTKLGVELLKEAKNTGDIFLENYELDELESIQPYQAQRKKTALVRMLAMKLFFIRTPNFKGYKIFTLFLNTKLQLTFKAFLGTIIRRFKGRI
jgi:coenzyme F420 hydrogenase subunit beta